MLNVMLRCYVVVLFSCVFLIGQRVQPLLPGATKVNPKDGLTYAWIPAGTFQMGCSPRDSGCASLYSTDKPVHQVTITTGFWMGQTEVTQDAYQWVMGANPSLFKQAKRPVENLSWFDAKRYCETAGMRLPTEAEWEYAARAGTKGGRYGEIDRVAWYSGNSESTAHPVGGKQPNAWGLYDTLGNLLEWVADWRLLYQPGNATDPQGPENSEERVVRNRFGGFPPEQVRVSIRDGLPPEVHGADTGVRCAGN